MKDTPASRIKRMEEAAPYRDVLDRAVRRIAARLPPGAEDIDDLRQEAALALLKELPKFKSESGVPIEAFLYRRIGFRLQDYLRDRDFLTRSQRAAVKRGEFVAFQVEEKYADPLPAAPRPSRAEKDPGAEPRITAKEMAAWQALATSGESIKVLAARLGNSPKTIEAHLAALRKKMGVYTNCELAVLGWRRGVVSRTQEDVEASMARQILRRISTLEGELIPLKRIAATLPHSDSSLRGDAGKDSDA